MAPALHRAEGRRYESPSGASVAEFLMVHQQSLATRLHLFINRLALIELGLGEEYCRRL